MRMGYDKPRYFRGWGASEKDLENVKRRDKIKITTAKKKYPVS